MFALRPRVFVGSSSERLPVAKAIQSLLDFECEVTLWSQGVFGLSQFAFDELVRSVESSDFAILVVDADDTRESRGESAEVARDNVVFEYGLFSGALGRSRSFLVHDRTRPPVLPTDLLGLTPATYHPHSSGNLKASLGPASEEILAVIRELGPRENQDDLGLFSRGEIGDKVGSIASRLELDGMRS